MEDVIEQTNDDVSMEFMAKLTPAEQSRADTIAFAEKMNLKKNNPELYKQKYETEQQPQTVNEPEVKPEPEENDWSIMNETVGQVVGGVVDAAANTARAAGELGDWLEEKLPMGYITITENGIEWKDDIPEDKKLSLSQIRQPDLFKNDTTAGGMLRGVVQFVAGFYGAGKFSAISKTANVGKKVKTASIVTKGFAADATVFDPQADNLSNLVEQYPALKNPVSEYLAANDDDTTAEARFKKGIEGMGLGFAAEGLFRAIKTIKFNKTAKETEIESTVKTDEPQPSDVASEKSDVPDVKLNQENIDELTDTLTDPNTKKIPDTEDFNFNRIETSDDIKEVINKTAEKMADDITKAKRGVVSHAETKELADWLGTDPDKLQKLRDGTYQLDSQLLAARELVVTSATRLKQLADAAKTGEQQALLKLKKHVVIHAGLQAELTGAKAEVGRALQAMRITAKTSEAQLKELDAILNSGNVDAQFAQRISNLADEGTTQLNQFVRKTAYAKTKTAVHFYYINALLSSPMTHATNILSNTLVAATQVPERALAAGFKRFAGKEADDVITIGEVNAQMYGMLQGIVDAFRIVPRAGEPDLSVWKSFKENQTIIGKNDKVEYMTEGISGDALNMKEGVFADVVDLIGKTTGLPTRLLTTEDQLFKTIGYRMELNALAFRETRRLGYTGKEQAEKIAEIMRDVPNDMHEAAVKAAEYQTFTKDLERWGKTVQNVVNHEPSGLLKLNIPFIRTPTNIMKYFGERTPGLNLISSNIRADYAAGGARRQLMLARSTMGGIMYTIGFSMAASGNLTGSFPKDEKTARIMAGEQEYSIKIGNKYYSYRRMEPLGSFLGVAADLYNIGGFMDDEERENVLSAFTIALSNNVTSKTFMTGFTRLINALDDSERYAERYIQDLAVSFIPQASMATRKQTDDTMREVETLLDKAKNKIPGWSDSLPPKRDFFGEVVLYRGGLGPDMISPIYNSEYTDDPVRTVMADLGMNIKKLPNQIKGVELTPEQYDDYQQIFGKALHKDLLKLVKGKKFKKLSDDQDGYDGSKKHYIKKYITAHKERSRGVMLMKYPEIINEYKQIKIKQANVLKGK